MTAEQIVRALAAADPTVFEDAFARYECTLCDGATDEKDDLGGPVYLSREDHEPDCPWRLAVEWVAADRERAALHDRFGPQYKIPAGTTVTTVWSSGMEGFPVELVEPVTGPGEFYFDADERRLVRYTKARP